MFPGILCKDRNKHCQDWARHGHCERNPKWMRSNCKASCNQTDCDREPQKPSGNILRRQPRIVKIASFSK